MEWMSCGRVVRKEFVWFVVSISGGVSRSVLGVMVLMMKFVFSAVVVSFFVIGVRRYRFSSRFLLVMWVISGVFVMRVLFVIWLLI